MTELPRHIVNALARLKEQKRRAKMPIEPVPLTGAELARWCYENPNQAANTIEGLRTFNTRERELLLTIERLRTAQREALRLSEVAIDAISRC